MSIELKVPALGESITEVGIGEWKKKAGEPVRRDETIAVLESEKAAVDLPSPVDGVIVKLLKKRGDSAQVGEVIATIDERSAPKSADGSAAKTDAAAAREPKPAVIAQPHGEQPRVMPAAQRALAERGLKPEHVAASGPGGRVLKEDVDRAAEQGKGEPTQAPPAEPQPTSPAHVAKPVGGRDEEVVPMNRLRRTLAERLVQAQHNAALLTTFNEVDMTDVMAMRKQFGEAFQQKHGVKLGFMSFFVKASIDALKQFPAVNAEVRGTDVVYRNYFDVGIAVGGGRGLVVPVLRNAERMSFAEIEIAIGDFAKRAKDNKLTLDELQGGTFTISNGGIYGSLLSTPIINPPQSGILGLHAIQERPVAREGQVVIRPMMYLALTYDHRIVDGREAVTFLRRIKETIETPARMLIEA